MSKEEVLNNFEDFKVNLDDFNGPIDLLFNLIKERKFNILNLDLLYISITYIEYVKKNIYNMKIDDITEYLSMITYFFELKSKRILSQTTNQEKIESEMDYDKFIQRILLHKKFKELVPDLSNRMLNRNKMLTKEVENINISNIHTEELPESMSPNIILKAMQNIFKKLNLNENDIINIEINELSIEDVTNEIINFLSNFNNYKMPLFKLLSSFPREKLNKQYLAVTFVALLVLVRDGNIILEQDILNNGDIIIQKINLGIQNV